MEELTRLFVELTLRTASYTRGIQSEIGKAAGYAENFGRNFNAALQRTILIGVTAILGTLALIGTNAVQDAAAFEAQISNVQAVLGETDETAQRLADTALGLSLDPTLLVDATQAAGAFELLAQNGIDAQTILDGMGESSIRLTNATKGAGATTGDFANSADILTDTMVLFNREANEAAAVVDSITGVTNNSKVSIDSYRFALAGVGGVAATMGLTLEEVNTALALASSSFADGSTLGNGFKSFLNQLIPTTNTAKDRMRELGLITLDTDAAMALLAQNGIEVGTNGVDHISEGLEVLRGNMGITREEFEAFLTDTGAIGNTFFDAEGNIKDFDEIVNILNQSMAGLTDEQRATALKELFGSRGQIFASALIDRGRDMQQVFNDLSLDVNELGQAQANVETRVDNLAGAMEILRSIAGGLSIQLGDVLLPFVRDLVQWFSDLAATHGPAVIERFQGMIDILSIIAGTLEAVTGDGRSFEDVLRAVSAELQGFGVGASIIPIIDGIADAVAFFSENRTAVVGAIRAVVGALTGFVAVASVLAIVTALANPLTLIAVAAGVLGAAWATNWGGIQEKTATVWAIIQPILQGLLNIVQNVFGWLIENGSPILDLILGIGAAFVTWSAITTIIGAITTVATVLPALIATITTGATALGTLAGLIAASSSPIGVIVAILGGPVTVAIAAVTALVGLLAVAWRRNWFDIQGRTASAIAAIRGAIAGVKNWIDTVFLPFVASIPARWGAFWEMVGQRTEAFRDRVREAFNAVRDRISSFATTVSNFINNRIIPVINFFVELWQLQFTIVSNAIRLAGQVIFAIFAEIGRWINENIVPWIVFLVEQQLLAWQSMQDAIMLAWEFIRDNIFIPLGTWLNDTLTAALDWLSEKVSEAWTAIQTAIQTAWAVIEPIFETVRKWLRETLSNAVTWLRETMETAWSAIQGAIEAAWSVIKPIFDAIRGFADWIASADFSLNISLPDLPSWALPGSPLPIHTRWRDFIGFMNNSTITTGVDLPTVDPDVLQLDQVDNKLTLVADTNMLQGVTIDPISAEIGAITQALDPVIVSTVEIDNLIGDVPTIDAESIGLDSAWADFVEAANNTELKPQIDFDRFDTEMVFETGENGVESTVENSATTAGQPNERDAGLKIDGDVLVVSPLDNAQTFAFSFLDELTDGRL